MPRHLYAILAVFIMALSFNAYVIAKDGKIISAETIERFIGEVEFDPYEEYEDSFYMDEHNEAYFEEEDVLELARMLLDAVESNDVELVRSLLNSGVNPNIDAFDSYSALRTAKYLGHEEIAQILIDAGATGDFDDDVIAVSNAIMNGNNDYLISQLNMGLDPNSVNEYDTNLLILSVVYDNLDAVRILLNAGVDPDSGGREEYGDHVTALMVAAQVGNLELVRTLLDAGANINHIGRDNTALLYAIRNEQLEIVKELIRRGADVNPPLNDAYSPLNWAEYIGNDELVEILIEAGAIDYP